MPNGLEVEIKFPIESLPDLTARLQSAGFRLVTQRTHELNTLYDLPGDPLRSRGALLRLRQYGSRWTVTYKDKSAAQGRHKTRREIETAIEDGQALAEILEAVGFKPSFAYEKFRSEWTDGAGHVVVDETPIGNFGEIEGMPDWIDATARKLAIPESRYIKASYADLFAEWKRRTRSGASNMTFEAISRTG
jgi:adenylate cyclase class 2